MQGILMKPDMHQAIRENRKMVTRRVIKELSDNPDSWSAIDIKKNKEGKQCVFIWQPLDLSVPSKIIKPRYHVDEVVYIKEAYCYESDSFAVKPRLRYKLGGLKEIDPGDIPIGVEIYNYLSDDYPNCIKWRTPLFMPTLLARDFIKITDVEPERLKEITPSEAIKECFGGIDKDPVLAVVQFINKWDSINPKHPFSSNPWVWRYAFQPYEEAHV